MSRGEVEFRGTAKSYQAFYGFRLRGEGSSDVSKKKMSKSSSNSDLFSGLRYRFSVGDYFCQHQGRSVKAAMEPASLCCKRVLSHQKQFY